MQNMYDSPDWLAPLSVGNEAILMVSSVGVNPGSCLKPGSGLMSRGLSISEVGVAEGTGRVGSNEVGYDRGSVRLDGALERDEMEDVDEAIEGAISLFMVDSVEVDMLDATDIREW